MNNQRKIGVMLSYLNLILSFFIPFFYTPIMLRILGQSQYGVYGIAQSVTSYLNLLSFGMGTTVTRYITKYKAKKEYIKMENILGLFLFVYVIISLIVLIVGILLSIFSNELFSNGLSINELGTLKILIILMTLSVPIGLIGSIYSSLMLVYEQFTFSSVLGIVATILAPIANLISLYLGFASIGLVCSGILVQIIYLIINILFCKDKLNVKARFNNMPFNKLKNIFSFSFIIFMSSIADLLFWSTDKVLIGAALGSVQVAIYNIGGTFTSIFQNMTSVISRIFAPEANNIVFENKPIQDSSNLLVRIGRLQYYIAILIISGFIVFGKYFLVYWAGEGYEQSYYIALFTMVPMTIPLIQNIAFVTITALKKHLFRSIVYFGIAIINAVSTYFIIPYFGVLGAAICTALSYVIGQGIILNVYYWKVIRLDIPRFWSNIIKMTIVPGAMIMVSLYIFTIISVNSLITLFIYIVIYTFIYCVLSWLFTMNEYEKGLIKGIFNKLFRRFV